MRAQLGWVCRNRIKTAASEGMAAQNSAHREETAAQNAETLDGLLSIDRTRGLVATGLAERG